MTLQTVLSDQHNNPGNHWPETNHWKRATTCSDSTCLALSVIFSWKVGSAHHHKTSGSYAHFLCCFLFSFWLLFPEELKRFSIWLWVYLFQGFYKGFVFGVRHGAGMWECENVCLTAWWDTSKLMRAEQHNCWNECRHCTLLRIKDISNLIFLYILTFCICFNLQFHAVTTIKVWLGLDTGLSFGLPSFVATKMSRHLLMQMYDMVTWRWDYWWGISGAVFCVGQRSFWCFCSCM